MTDDPYRAAASAGSVCGRCGDPRPTAPEYVRDGVRLCEPCHWRLGVIEAENRRVAAVSVARPSRGRVGLALAVVVVIVAGICAWWFLVWIARTRMGE